MFTLYDLCQVMRLKAAWNACIGSYRKTNWLMIVSDSVLLEAA